MDYQEKPYIQFNDEFYLPEDRNGFHIMGLMKRAWAAQMEVLMEIDRICNKYNLTWFADGGTLLGAIRHKGFIPWDDDIDITMKRDDYDVLMKVLPRELPRGYNWFCPDRVDWDPIAFLRIINTSEINFDKAFLERYHGCPYLCGVDIFPLDGVPEDTDEWELLQSIARLLIDGVDIIKKGNSNDTSSFLYEVENACGVKLDRTGNIIKQLMRLVDSLAKSYSIVESSQVATLCMYCYGYQKTPRNKNWYSDIVYVKYEGIEIPIPNGSHEILRALYGDDYMTPIRGGQLHDYPFFEKQKKGAQRLINMNDGFEDREKRVAEYLDMDVLEVFEYRLVSTSEVGDIYNYFCQSEMKNIMIPHNKEESIRVLSE